MKSWEKSVGFAPHLSPNSPRFRIAKRLNFCHSPTNDPHLSLSNPMRASLFFPYSQLMAAIALSLITHSGLAADQTSAARSADAVPFRFPDRITTLDGKTYNKVILDKVEPDGLLVQFAPVEGGSGTAKLKLRNLPAEFRE